MPPASRRERALRLAGGSSLALSAIPPHGYFTWLLAVAPILIGEPILATTNASFPRTPPFYRLIFLLRRTMVSGRGGSSSSTPACASLQRVLRAGRMVDGGADRIRGHDTQGDPWDTHWVGVPSSPLVLGRVHDRQLI